MGLVCPPFYFFPQGRRCQIALVLIQFSGRYVYDTCEKVVVDLFSRQSKLAICIFRCLIVTVLYLFVDVDRRLRRSLCTATLSEFVYQYVCISLSLYC